MIQTIALICGGRGPERDVSLMGTQYVQEVFEAQGEYKVQVYDMPNDLEALCKNKQDIDFAFVLIHGTDGEDGRIPALLELLEIPYQWASSDVHSLCLNKARTKQIWRARRLPVVNEYVWDIGHFSINQIEGIIYNVGGYPVVIKTITGGSSQGMYFIRNHEDLLHNYPDIKQHSEDMMVEQMIEGDEYTVAVLEDNNGKPRALPAVQIIPPEGQTFDYENKYNGLTQEICPAPINKTLHDQLKELAVYAHKAIGARGYSRIDMINGSQGPILLEVNTIPGFTKGSLFPKAAAAEKIDMPKLLDILIERGLNK